MTDRFSDDDRGKDVVAPDGTSIGTVNQINEDRATVERREDQDLTDKVKDMLGWGDDDSNELRSEHVESRDGDKIRLRDNT